MKRRTHGFTIVELLVVVSIIALLIAILLPAIGKARDAARQTQSAGNLRNLAVANNTYAADWADRQFTGCPDDIGLVAGDPIRYNTEVGCMGQLLARATTRTARSSGRGVAVGCVRRTSPATA